MSAVTYLPGAAPRPPCGPADPRVIALLEGLLARARRGEVLAAAVAMVVPHDEHQVTAALSWSAVPEHHMALVGAASKLARDITEARSMRNRITDAYLRRAIGKRVRLVFNDSDAAVATLLGVDAEAIEVREATRPQGYPSSLVFKRALISIQVVEA